MTYKELISKIYKVLLQLNIKKNSKIKDIRPEYTFSKENIQMANSLVKRCSTSPIIKEMEIKTMRYHFTHVRMAIIKKSTNNKRCRGYR